MSAYGEHGEGGGRDIPTKTVKHSLSKYKIINKEERSVVSRRGELQHEGDALAGQGVGGHEVGQSALLQVHAARRGLGVSAQELAPPPHLLCNTHTHTPHVSLP